MKRGEGAKPIQQNALLNAVALQDHFARSLKLGLPVGRGGIGPLHRGKGLASATCTGSPTTVASPASPSPAGREGRKPVLGASGGASPAGTSPKKKTGAGGSKASKAPAEPELTLAQRYGLVERPPPRLTEEEWRSAHIASQARQDSLQPCPICRDDFQDQEQVLLACSHVFHKHCLRSFEKFVDEKCCPLCRAKYRQKRVIDDGASMWRDRCATRIQAAVRGYFVRIWFKKLLASVPPSDPVKRRNWFAQKLEEANERLLKVMADEHDELETLFAEIDQNIAQSNRVFRAAETAVWGQPCSISDGDNGGGGGMASPPHGDASDGLDGVEHRQAGQAQAEEALPHSSGQDVAAASRSAAHGEANEPDWDEIRARIRDRGEDECPICICPLTKKGAVGIAILSCAHAFHSNCILAFEKYNACFAKADVGHACPVCRTNYKRIVRNKL